MSQGETHRRHTKEFKSDAVRLSLQPGMTMRRAASDLGISLNVLFRWKNELKESGDDAFEATAFARRPMRSWFVFGGRTPS